MAIQQRLQTRLAQKLILTPSLQQAIKLLPMSTLELADLLNQEVVENPLLEEIPTEDLQATEAQPATEKEPEKPAATEKSDRWDDADYEYFCGEYLEDSSRPRAPLEWQLSLLTNDDTVREIGEAIIGNLNDDGYLVASVDEIAGMGPWPVAQVEDVLRMIQGFDPIGVAARDLQECLTLQVRHLQLD